MRTSTCQKILIENYIHLGIQPIEILVELLDDCVFNYSDICGQLYISVDYQNNSPIDIITDYYQIRDNLLYPLDWSPSDCLIESPPQRVIITRQLGHTLIFNFFNRYNIHISDLIIDAINYDEQILNVDIKRKYRDQYQPYPYNHIKDTAFIEYSTGDLELLTNFYNISYFQISW